MDRLFPAAPIPSLQLYHPAFNEPFSVSPILFIHEISLLTLLEVRCTKLLKSHTASTFITDCDRTTRSSDIITLQRPSVHSRLKVTDRSFTHHAPVLWNSLPKQLRQPFTHQSLSNPNDSTPCLALSSHQFHSKLKTFLFNQSFPP